MFSLKSYFTFYKSLIFKSFLAGCMIGLGCVAYCYTSPVSTILGSLLFSLGLLCVIMQEHALYTGKIGYAETTWNMLFNLTVMFIFNIIGIVAFCWLFTLTRIAPDITAKASALAELKINDSLLSMFILGIGCGILVFLAVDNYRKGLNPILVILPIMFFILCGFEHCIADAGYFALAKTELSMDLAILILVVTAGNSLGSILIYRLNKH